MMSILGKEVSSGRHICNPFPRNHLGLHMLVGVKSSQRWMEASHRGWGKIGLDSNILKCH